MATDVSLMDVHGAISNLAFAVSQTLEPLSVDVRVAWDRFTYLHVDVECRERDRQTVVDRLSHGALTGSYDYRFSVSHPLGEKDPDAWVVVKAYPNLSHDDKIRREERKAA